VIRGKEMSVMAERGKGEFWAFVAGVLAGGIAALLYAPAKGSETRVKLRETAGELKAKGGELAAQAREEAGRVIESGRLKLDETKQRIGEAGQKLDQTTQKVRESIEGAKLKGAEKIEQIRGRLAGTGEEPSE
jgi:gas vesicle protein